MYQERIESSGAALASSTLEQRLKVAMLKRVEEAVGCLTWSDFLDGNFVDNAKRVNDLTSLSPVSANFDSPEWYASWCNDESETLRVTASIAFQGEELLVSELFTANLPDRCELELDPRCFKLFCNGMIGNPDSVISPVRKGLFVCSRLLAAQASAIDEANIYRETATRTLLRIVTDELKAREYI